MNITRIEEITIEAGNAVMRIRQDGYNKDQKADGSPITEADLAADAIIIRALTALNPDIPAITEETWNADTDLDPDAYWCVDPIDGTKGFINGSPDFTVNIGLIKNNYPVLGVIYAPALGTIWTGYDGKAWMRKNDGEGDKTLGLMGVATAISARNINPNTPDIVATRAHRGQMLDSWINRLNPATSIAVGSSLKFCTLAEGHADLYPRIGPTMEWDTAAGQAILEAAGGTMVGGNGARFYYGKKGRLNGVFSAIGKVNGAIPQNWLPPSSLPNPQKC